MFWPPPSEVPCSFLRLDTPAQSAKPQVQVVLSSVPPSHSFQTILCQTARRQDRQQLRIHGELLRQERAHGAHPSVGRLGAPWGGTALPARTANEGVWLLRVSCRLAFFLTFPEHDPWPPSFFLLLDHFQSR